MTTLTHITSSSVALATRRSRYGVGFIATCLIAATASPLICAQSENYLATEPVGFVSVTVEGSSDGRAKSIFITPSLVSPIEWSGEVSSVSGNTVHFSSGNWQSGDYDSRYYLEVTSGDHEGIWTDIVSSPSGSLVLNEPIGSYVSAGTKVVIRRFNTIESHFGTAATSGLQAAANPALADNILVYSGASSKRYWLYNGTGGSGPGWYDINWQPAGHTRLAYGDGIVIQRNSQAPLSLHFAGAVKSGVGSVAVDTMNNVMGGIAPVDIPLVQSGLYTGNATSGIKAGTNPAESDYITIYRGDGSSAMYWYYTGPHTTDGWHDINWKPAGHVVIPANGTFVLRRQHGGEFQWFIPSLID